jgi:hypothetical protein
MAMQKITFSADADLLDRGRTDCESKSTTLEEEVRQWLNDLGAGKWNLAPTESQKRKARKSAKD